MRNLFVFLLGGVVLLISIPLTLLMMFLIIPAIIWMETPENIPVFYVFNRVCLELK